MAPQFYALQHGKYIRIPELLIMSHYTNETIMCHFLEVSSLLFNNVSSNSQVTKS